MLIRGIKTMNRNIERTNSDDSVQPKNQILYCPPKLESKEKPNSNFFAEDCQLKTDDKNKKEIDNKTTEESHMDKIKDGSEKTKKTFKEKFFSTFHKGKNKETFDDCNKEKSNQIENFSELEQTTEQHIEDEKSIESNSLSREKSLKQELNDLYEKKQARELETKARFKNMENYQYGTPEYKQALEDYNHSRSELNETKKNYDMMISDTLNDGEKAKKLVDSDIEEAKGLDQRYNEDINEFLLNNKKLNKEQLKELEYVKSTNDKYIYIMSQKRDAISLEVVAKTEKIIRKQDEFKHDNKFNNDDTNLKKIMEMERNRKETEEKLHEVDCYIDKLKNNNREIEEIISGKKK